MVVVVEKNEGNEWFLCLLTLLTVVFDDDGTFGLFACLAVSFLQHDSGRNTDGISASGVQEDRLFIMDNKTNAHDYTPPHQTSF